MSFPLIFRRCPAIMLPSVLSRVFPQASSVQQRGLVNARI